MNPPETQLGEQKHSFDDTFSAFDAVKTHLGIVTDDGPKPLGSVDADAFLGKKIKEFNDKATAQYHLDLFGITMVVGLGFVAGLTAYLTVTFPY